MSRAREKDVSSSAGSFEANDVPLVLTRLLYNKQLALLYYSLERERGDIYSLQLERPQTPSRSKEEEEVPPTYLPGTAFGFPLLLSPLRGFAVCVCVYSYTRNNNSFLIVKYTVHNRRRRPSLLREYPLRGGGGSASKDIRATTASMRRENQKRKKK